MVSQLPITPVLLQSDPHEIFHNINFIEELPSCYIINTPKYTETILHICDIECCLTDIKRRVHYQRLERCDLCDCKCSDYNQSCKFFYRYKGNYLVGFRICQPNHLSTDELNFLNNKYSSTIYHESHCKNNVFCKYIKVPCKYCDQNSMKKSRNCQGKIVVKCSQCGVNAILSENKPSDAYKGIGIITCQCRTGIVTCYMCSGKSYYFVNISRPCVLS
jgi:hypothetical protein